MTVFWAANGSEMVLNYTGGQSVKHVVAPELASLVPHRGGAGGLRGTFRPLDTI